MKVIKTDDLRFYAEGTGGKIRRLIERLQPRIAGLRSHVALNELEMQELKMLEIFKYNLEELFK